MSPPACRPVEPGRWVGPSHGELGRGTAEGGDERAQVQEHAYPAGSHLDPEDGPAPAEEAFNVGTFVAAETRGPAVVRTSYLPLSVSLPASTPLQPFSSGNSIQT